MNDVGKMKGDLKGLEVEEVDYNEEPKPNQTTKSSNQKSSGGGGGFFSSLKGLVGGKVLTKETIQPVIEKMQDHLIGTSFFLFYLCLHCLEFIYFEF